MAKTYTSVDVGSSALKLAVVQDDAVLRTKIVQIPEGLVADGRIVSVDAMADFIKRSVNGLEGAGKNAAFVMPAADCIVRTVSLPLMTVKELALNLPYEFRDYISQGKDNYAYDYAVLGRRPDTDGEGEALDLMAVASQKQTIEAFSGMFRRAGMKLEVALPEQAALQNLVFSSDFAHSTICIIDFGQRATRLFFFDNGKFDVMRVVEIGGSSIDKAIASEYGVDERIASDYKLSDFESARSCEAAKGVYEEIAIEVSRAINFYEFNNPNASIEATFCIGGCSNISQLLESVDRYANIDLRSIADMVSFEDLSDSEAASAAVATGAAFKVGC